MLVDVAPEGQHLIWHQSKLGMSALDKIVVRVLLACQMYVHADES